MKEKIINLLKQTDGFVSGQQLCEQFGVSRTAVWKVIEQLKKEGYEVEAVRRKGYRLKSSPDVLTETEIREYLTTKEFAQEILTYEETDSTNIRAKVFGEQPDGHGTLFVADQQTAGRGRRGRSWNSPPGSSISMTVLLKPDLHPNQAPMLTLVMALSTAQALQKVTGEEFLIKWPNDIVRNGRKVVGILTEMAAEMEAIHYVVIGVGVNVKQEDFPEEIAEVATSLKRELGQDYRRAQIVAEILNAFEKNYEEFEKAGDLAPLLDAYTALLVNKDREVRVLDPKGAFDAVAEGVTKQGDLLVKLPDGNVKEIYAGEVSVRGIYGYL